MSLAAGAEDDLGSVVVEAVVEVELRLLLLQAADRPAREAARDLGDVALRVAAVDAKRVQLHELAPVVLVEPSAGVLRGGLLRARIKDPALGGSLVSNAFSYMGALWQSATLPVLVLGVMGMLRALIARKGRAWMLVALVHAASLAGATVILHAGTQPRYFILIAAVFAAYAGVAVAGILEAGRAVGWATVGLAAVLFVVTPPMYPGRNDLWIRRDPELRRASSASSRACSARTSCARGP